MRNKLLIVCFLFSFNSPFGNLDRVRRALDRLEFEKAHELLQKAQAKEPENPGVDYLAAVLFSTSEYQNYNLDTARVIVEKSLNRFESVDEKLKSELIDDGIDQESISELRIDIRNRIYQNVLKSLSVKTAEDFMEWYPKSAFSNDLVYKRDSMVFIEVRRKDELSAYMQFLNGYQTEEFRKISLQRMDQLRFKSLVETGELKNYYEFLRNHPKTAFRDEIEAYVFKVSTIDHTPQRYLDFLDFAKNDALRKKAGDILFYHSGRDGVSFSHPNVDSIRVVNQYSDFSLIPALDNGLFGFHASNGDQLVPYRFEQVSDAYKCSMTDYDWLYVTENGVKSIISKRGDLIIDKVEDYQDLGEDISKVKIDGGWFVYHKSGFKIEEEPIEDAVSLNQRWIKVKRRGRWAMISYSGHRITDHTFDDIEIEGGYWFFEKDGLLAIETEAGIARMLNNKGLELEYKFDDYELVTDEMIIGFRGDRECMLDADLNFLIPWGEYEINPAESGWYLRTNDGYRLYDHSENDIMNQIHPYLETNKGWLVLKTIEDWMLLPRHGELLPSRDYDSLKLINDHCVWSQKDGKVNLIFGGGTSIEIDSTSGVRSFLNNSTHVLIREPDRLRLLDENGVPVLEGEFDDITFLSDSLLLTKKDSKSGLVSLKGQELTDLEYDAFDIEEDLILCLKDGNIGCIDLTNQVEIPASYESRIERIENFYLAKKNGKYGVIDSLESEILPFVFDEIKQWNDTSFLTRVDNEWLFLNHSRDSIGESFSFLTKMLDHEDQQIWKFVSKGKYGLLSSINGVILNPDFSDIMNIGTEEIPIFFADQHLDKAGYHVVSYIDKAGQLLFSKAYKSDEFDLILCED